MAAPQIKRFATLVSDFAAAAQSSASTPLDFSIGSILRALAEASAGVGTWLQKLYLFALSVTRLSTSQGRWVDSFLADYGVSRLPAVPATGPVTFSRLTATAPGLVQVGAQVGTPDGTATFTVYADPSNPYYSSTAGTAGGYVIPASIVSIDVPVQSTVAGSVGNVGAGQISSLRSAVLGIDRVLNGAAFTNGLAAESDPAARARFQLFLASLSKATNGAIGYAVLSLQQGIRYTILENSDLAGDFQPGLITVIIDDGSGSPPASLVTSASAAVNAVRASGVQYAVLGATPLDATVQMTMAYAPGYLATDVIPLVATALTNYVAGLSLGQTLRFTRLEQLAYNASPGVENVTSVTLNGTTTDLVPTPGQAIKLLSLILS